MADLYSHAATLLRGDRGSGATNGKHAGRKDPTSNHTGSGSGRGERLRSSQGLSHRREPSSSASRKQKQDIAHQLQLGKILRQVVHRKGVTVEGKVVGGAISSESGDKHVEYQISSFLQADNLSRRYTEFKELDVALRTRFPHLVLPPVPDVSWRIKLFSRRTLDPAYVAAKGRLLNDYLLALSKISQVRASPEFLAFLFSPKRSKTLDSDGNRFSQDSSQHQVLFRAPESQIAQNAERSHTRTTVSTEKPKSSNFVLCEDGSESEEEEELSTLVAKAKSLRQDLVETPCSLPSKHPFISKLITRRQPFSISRCNTIEEMLSCKTVLLDLDRSGVELCLDQFSLSQDGTLNGATTLDGHKLRLNAELSSDKPPLAGTATIIAIP